MQEKTSEIGCLWKEYYAEFSYFGKELVRDGCHAWKMEHPQVNDKSIILIHGLTDSPHYMVAIGEFFYSTLGYNVYLPLLHCHALKEPEGMENVKLSEWLANVEYAIDHASSKSEFVSIGGLSTGGVLSFHSTCKDQRITGDLFLFSAALDLAGRKGNVKEWLLRSFLSDLLDSRNPLIGRNPYRYCRMDYDGAGELADLIKITDELQKEYNQQNPFPKRIFAAHSEADSTADIAGIEALAETAPSTFEFFTIPKNREIPHASVVLDKPVVASDNGDVLEIANPLFSRMMNEVQRFVEE